MFVRYSVESVVTCHICISQDSGDVVDVLISSVTVPQGQRYDSQRSHTDPTNRMCAGKYESVCVCCVLEWGVQHLPEFNFTPQ